MSRARLVAILTLAALALSCAAIILAGCASSESTSTSGEPWSAESADPDFLRRAADVLANADEHVRGWNVAIILAEDDEGYSARWVVMDAAGELTILEPAYTCNDDDTTEEGDLYLMLSPGDLIAWDPKGNDTRLCTAEVDVTAVGAALPPA